MKDTRTTVRASIDLALKPSAAFEEHLPLFAGTGARFLLARKRRV